MEVRRGRGSGEGVPCSGSGSRLEYQYSRPGAGWLEEGKIFASAGFRFTHSVIVGRRIECRSHARKGAEER